MIPPNSETLRATSMLRVTLRDVARSLSVSHTTVSLALRNDPRISEPRRWQIHSRAQQMGYRPDPAVVAMATSRRSRKTAPALRRVIGWIDPIPTQAGPARSAEFEAYCRGAKEAAEKKGYQLEALDWPPHMPSERMKQILLTRGIRGLVAAPDLAGRDWGNFPAGFLIVSLGHRLANCASHLVTTNQVQAITLAREAMVRRGYRRIGLVIRRELDTVLGGRYLGGCHFGLPTDEAPLLLTDSATHPWILRSWIERYRPDALLTSDHRVPGYLHELGWQVPGDIPLATTSVADLPGYAGIDQNSEEIGRVALDFLASMLEFSRRGEIVHPLRIELAGKWQDGPSLP